MRNTEILIHGMYADFNRRDIDGTLAAMGEGIDWPKASEGGRVVGKEAIRAYWTRQWAEYDPQVEPVEMLHREDGVTEVRVRQVVKDLHGTVLSERMVWHVYTIVDGLIERMDIRDGGFV